MRDLSVPIEDGHINVWHREPAPGAPTVVLIHGLTGTSRWWIPVISHLSDTPGLLAVDVRGRGQSWQAPPPYDLATAADDVARALDHLGVPRAGVAGYSMGAWVAALFATRHPDRVGSLLLVDGGLPLESDPSLTPEQVVEQAVGPALARLTMEFETMDAYFDFWRRHPALDGSWTSQLEEVFAYDMHEVEGTLRARANVEAITVAGADLAVGIQANEAFRTIQAPTTELIVDHGLLGQPGGFIPEVTASMAVGENPNLAYRMIEGPNHYTLMLGAGAPEVAAAISVDH